MDSGSAIVMAVMSLFVGMFIEARFSPLHTYWNRNLERLRSLDATPPSHEGKDSGFQ